MLINLYNFAAQKNISIYTINFEEIKALSMRHAKAYAIALSPTHITSTTEECSILAHELGHCETGSLYNADNPFDLKDKCEYKANKWVYLNILTQDAFNQAFALGHKTPWELADYLGMTEDIILSAWDFHKNQALS